MLLAIPGATALGAAFVSSPRTDLVVYVVIAATILAPLVAAYDDADRSAAIGVPLLALATIGAFLTVPDTDVVVVVATAAAPFLFAGPPLALSRLGRAGAQAGTGLVIWVVAVGGEARSAALFAGTAALGLLIVAPLLGALRRPATVTGIAALGVQAGLVVVLASIAGLSTGVVALLSVTLLALVAVVAVAPQWANRPLARS
jgi:hypothetical protein